MPISSVSGSSLMSIYDFPSTERNRILPSSQFLRNLQKGKIHSSEGKFPPTEKQAHLPRIDLEIPCPWRPHGGTLPRHSLWAGALHL